MFEHDDVPAFELEGFRLVTTTQVHGYGKGDVRFEILRPDGRPAVGAHITVSPPRLENEYGYHRSSEDRARISASSFNGDHLLMRLFAEGALLAAQLAEVYDEAYASQIEDAKQKRAEKERERRKLYAEDRVRMTKWCVLVKEELQWLVGQNGRVWRRYRDSSFSMRPIQRVSDSGLHFDTDKLYERIDLPFKDLIKVEIKYDGDRKYTPVALPTLQSVTVTEEEIEEFVNES